jgi:hypothetical protein
MKTEHTPEPWATNGTRIESENNHGWVNDGWIIAGLEGPDAEANARRIVACVNACAGIETFMLEMLLENKRTVMQDLDDLTNQRDELLAAAEAIEIDAEECLDFDECCAMLVPIDTYHKLMEAIASVKEKA